MLEVRPGDSIIGKSGKKILVDRIEGDLLFCGDRRIGIEAVVRVIPPTTVFKVGDRVKYIGSHFHLQRIYAGILEVWQVSPIDGYTLKKPDGRLTSWVDFADLEEVDMK